MDFKSFFSTLSIRWLLLPLLIALCAAFYRWFKWIPQDNPIEERIESYIERTTGYDIDLSPDSKE